MARKKYYFNTATLPKYIRSANGVKTEIHGYASNYSPANILFCECGAVIRGEQFKSTGNIAHWDGYTCPECGHTFARTDVLSRGTNSHEFGYNSQEIFIVPTYYNHREDDSEKGITKISLYSYDYSRDGSITKMSWSDVKILSLDNSVHEEILQNHRVKIAPAILKILEYCEDNDTNVPKRSCMESYIAWMNIREHFKDDPNLAKEIANDIDLACQTISAGYYHGTARSSQIPKTYAEYEAIVPEYLLPLTEKIVKDIHPCESHVSVGYKHYDWPQITPRTEMAATLVLHYYKSGLLSIDTLKQLLSRDKALQNPNFIRFFKAYYPQAVSYLTWLENNGENLVTHSLNVKDSYFDVNHEFFVKYGLTEKQVSEAIDAADGNYLDALINLGKSKRQRTAKAN